MEAAAPALHIGAMGFSYADWVGSFYPAGTRAADYLARYAERFDCLELDTTFYAVPRASAVQGWREHTPPHFRFAAKLPKTITHDNHLRDAEPTLHRFLDAIAPLGDKLGPLLIQLPPDFHATEDNQQALADFLRLLPSEYDFAAEFRHRSWLTDETTDLLRQYGVAWTMIDLFYMPRRLDRTSDFVYARLLGDRRKIEKVDRVQIDRTRELTEWAEVFSQVSAETRGVWIFVNNHFSGHSPADVRWLRERLGQPRESAASPAEPDASSSSEMQPRLL